MMRPEVAGHPLHTRRGTRAVASRANVYGALIVSVLALAVVGCTRNDARPRQPNVLLITFDTTRRDHCSVYGYERRTTPTLELLGAQGVVFDAAYAASSSTGPSHATLFTGLYPLAHGVVRNGGVLSDDKETLAERLVARGWQTAAFVSSFVLARRFGWAQGFEVYDGRVPLRDVEHGAPRADRPRPRPSRR